MKPKLETIVILKIFIIAADFYEFFSTEHQHYIASTEASCCFAGKKEEIKLRLEEKESAC